jgi:hypothetical protein
MAIIAVRVGNSISNLLSDHTRINTGAVDRHLSFLTFSLFAWVINNQLLINY